MLSSTRRALEDFDNSHEFERMAADILNGLGYTAVEPMAPRGGGDGGQDIQFKDGDSLGVAMVTLEKKVRSKFRRDLMKQSSPHELLAFFCSVDLSPATKLELTREAVARNFRLELFDLERLRSLLDTNLKDVRRRYLGIDDDVSARLRANVRKLLRFPAAMADKSERPSTLEALVANTLPRRLFTLLLEFEEHVIEETPGVGKVLHAFFLDYYEFRKAILDLESRVTEKIGKLVSVRFPVAWRIYLKYATMRFANVNQDVIIGWGNFLNYDLTWDEVERLFEVLRQDGYYPISTDS